MYSTDSSPNDGFDDVDINSITTIHQPQVADYTSLSYLNRKTTIIHSVASTDSFKNSSTNSSLENFNRAARSSKEKRLPSPPTSTQVITRSKTPSYSPSKKLKKIRELHREDFDISNNIDNSEDELDDSTIMFDVPMSQSLKQLAASEKVVRLNSLTSESTQQSSMMSFDHDGVDQDSDAEEADQMSRDGRKLHYEFYRNKSAQTIQESNMRRHYINSWNQKPKSVDGEQDYSQIKSKLITNTRPTYLPPKSSTESLKHQKEVERLKLEALKIQSKLEKQKLKELKEREILKSQDLKKWKYEILPDFENKIQLSSTRELWWRGIPAQLRPEIWIKLLNNRILTEERFNELRSKAESITEEPGNNKTLLLIEKDIVKVFPDLCLFQKNQQFHEDLKILMLMYDEYSGYQQGLITLAAVLLNSLQEVDSTFVCLVGIQQRHLLRTIYGNQNDLTQFSHDAESFLRTFSRLNPQLYDHFHNHLKIKPETYIIPLIKPLFTNILPMDVCSSIIDIFLFEGDSVIWRCVLGLFAKIGYKLYGSEREILDAIGWDAWNKLNKNRRLDPGTGGEVRYLDVGEDYEFLKLVRDVLKK